MIVSPRAAKLPLNAPAATVATVEELAGLEGVLEVLAGLLGLALAALVHLLHGVGGVVEPLPDEGEADDLAVAEDHGEVAGAEGLHVALHEVGVRGLAELS